MTREDIDNIIKVTCPNNEDFEKPCISPAYLKKELEALALEQKPTTERIEYGTDGNPYVLSMTNGRELEQDPCNTCGYEEGSIYCKEHCPHEAKIEQKTCDDVVSRQWLMKCVNEGWIKFDTEKDKNRFIHLVRDIAPSVTIESKIVALLEKTYNDFCKCEGGEGWLKIDGKEYFTDVGYAIDGMRIFVEVLKQRLAQSGAKT